MKNIKLFISSTALILFLTVFSNNVQAQQTYVYQHTDTKTFITSHMKIQYSGYQVAVWFKQTSANKPSAVWGKRAVSYNDDHLIKYTIPGNVEGKNKVTIEYDKYNHEAIYVIDIYGVKKKYFEVE